MEFVLNTAIKVNTYVYMYYMMVLRSAKFFKIL